MCEYVCVCECGAAVLLSQYDVFSASVKENATKHCENP